MSGERHSGIPDPWMGTMADRILTLHFLARFQRQAIP